MAPQKTVTYLDANVLIAAATGTGEVSRRAIEILDDPDRSLATSAFVRLECLPKPLFYKKQSAKFYEKYFAAVKIWARDFDAIVDIAFGEAVAHDIHPRDALHIGAAVAVGASELLTAERPTKPMFQTSSIAVRSIRPDVGP